MPAFWWLFNMYALARNSSKFQSRDKRIAKVQNIEFDSLAPDTVEEIFHARQLLEIWTAKAHLRQSGKTGAVASEELARIGRGLLTGSPESVAVLEVLGENMEKSHRKAVILKTHDGYQAYGDMLLHYAVQNLIAYLQNNPKADFAATKEALKGPRQQRWVNLGGQLAQSQDVDNLRADVVAGKLACWDDIHRRYDDLWRAYPLQKQKHAFAVLCELYQPADIAKELWLDALQKAGMVQQYVRDQVYLSRKKDFDNPFRQATFRNKDEMTAAIGTVEDNSFVKQVRQETETFAKTVAEIALRG